MVSKGWGRGMVNPLFFGDCERGFISRMGKYLELGHTNACSFCLWMLNVVAVG